MSHFLETQKGLTTIAGESDVMELMELNLQISNTNFYMRILLLFSLLIALCMSVFLEGRGCLSAVGMGGRMPIFSGTVSPFPYLKSHCGPAPVC